MKYSVPFKKLSSILEIELKNNPLGDILNIPLDIRNNPFFEFIYKQIYINITRNSSESYLDPIDPNFVYNDLSKIDQIKNSAFLQQIFDDIEIISTSKLSNSAARDLINKSTHLPTEKKTLYYAPHLTTFSIRSAKEVLKYFSHPIQFIYFESIVKNIFKDNTINLNFGSENGMPEHVFETQKDLNNFLSICLRPEKPQLIEIQSNSSDIILKALFPTYSQIIENNNFSELSFSFKNESFIDTLNEEILDDTFLQVANIESILLNIDSYIEDIDLMAQKYGYEEYITIIKSSSINFISNLLEKTQSSNNEFIKLIDDFYYFLSIIPKDILDDESSLNIICEKLNKKIDSLNNLPAIPLSDKFSIIINDNNILKITQTVINLNPISADKILLCIPDKDTLHNIYWSKEQTTRNKSYSFLKSGIELEIDKQKYSKEDIQLLLNSKDKDKWIYIITTIPNCFQMDIFHLPPIREKMIENMLHSITQSINPLFRLKKNYTPDNFFHNFILTLDIHESNHVLESITEIAQTIDLKKQSFFNFEEKDSQINIVKKNPHSYESNKINIINDLLQHKQQLLGIEFLELTFKSKDNPDNQNYKIHAQKKFLEISDFLHQISNHDNFKFPSRSIQEDSIYFNNRDKNFSFQHIKNFFLFNLFTPDIYQHTVNTITNTLFKSQEYHDYYRESILTEEPDYYLNFLTEIKKSDKTLFSLFVSYINMDDIIDKKHNFATPEWFDILANNKFSGNKNKTIQKIITQSEDDFNKLILCQKIIEKQSVDYSDFKISTKHLLSIQNHPHFAHHISDIFKTCPQMFDKISDSMKYNPNFWISIIEKCSDKKSLTKPLSQLDEILLEDKNLLLKLLPLYYSGDLKDSSYKLINKFETNIQELLKKPKYFLPFVESYSNYQLTTQTLNKLQPDISQFMKQNKIEQQNLFRVLSTVVQQSFIENDLTNNNIQSISKNKSIKF